MIFCILHVFLFETESKRPLISPLSFHIFITLLQSSYILFKNLLILIALIEFLGELCLHILNFGLVLTTYLRDHHFVISHTAVLQQHRKYFPNFGHQWVFLLGVLYQILDHLVKTYWVNKKATVNSIYEVARHTTIVHFYTIDAIPGDGVLVLWLQNASGYVQVFGISERFIDPRLHNLTGDANTI